MKKVVIFALMLMMGVAAMAQSSQKISYQAVLRDADNHLVTNSDNISVEISILDSNAVVAYAERHNNVHSNANGMISVMIGEGTVISGSMNGIAWKKAQIKTKVTKGGEVFIDETLPVTAVPYALYADNLNAGGQTLIHIYEALADTAGDIRADIPAAANDATITLQKNGTAVGNFTVNTATDKSINITVPENMSDLGDAANYVTVNRLGDTLSHYYTTTVINDTLNHYYTINNLNDTLGHYYTGGEINDTLGHYYTSSQIHDTLKVINDMLTVIENRVVEFNQHVCDSVQACVSALVSDSIHGAITRESIVVDEHYVHTDRNYTTADSLKLAGIEAGAQRNVQSDWKVSDATSDAYIQNKPTIPAAANDATITLQKNGTAVGNFTVNTATDKSINITVPENVSDLGDAANYVTVNRLGDTLSHYYTTTVINDTLNHYYTINNLNDTLGHYYTGGEINDTLGHYYTSSQIHDTLKVINDMLTVIETRVVEFNQHVCDSIQACVSALVSDSIHGAITRESIVVDEHYVHTDRNYTTADSLKLAGIEAGAQRNVQSDWNVSDATSDAYIQNKPTIPAAANDATITLQKNGTAVDNFTVNTATDKSINITVPENVSDLGDAANYVTVTKLEDTLNHIINKDACPTVNICDIAEMLNRVAQGIDSIGHVIIHHQETLDSTENEFDDLYNVTMPVLSLSSDPSSDQKICIGGGSVEVTYTATIANDDISSYTFVWTVDGSVQAESGNTFTQSYSGIGTKNIVCKATRTGVALSDSLITTISTQTPPSMTLCTDCYENVIYIKRSTGVSSAAWYNASNVQVGTWKSGNTDALAEGVYHVEISSSNGCVVTLNDIEVPPAKTYCTVTTINSNETGSGNKISEVKDHEGNSYKVVQIGSQCWLKENMRATTSPTTGTYFVRNDEVSLEARNYTYSGKEARWYNNDSLTYAPKGYGLLYNWNAYLDTFNTSLGELSRSRSSYDAVSFSYNSGHRRGICPQGWHVPQEEEWIVMEQQFTDQELRKDGQRGDHSGKLAGGCDWDNVAVNAGSPGDYSNVQRNISGLSILPSGDYLETWYFSDVRIAYFWRGTQYYHYLIYNRSDVFRATVMDMIKFGGQSVRCVRDEGSEIKPTVSTAAVSGITHESAVCGGSVTYDGGANITARGICWSTNDTPTLENNEGYTTDGTGAGSFISTMTGLSELTTYYVRAYATNSEGTSYGSVKSFTTCTPLTMDFTVNTGNSDDFGKVTINSTTATGATWYNSNDDVLGTWISGNTAILPVDTYHVVLTNSCGMTADTGFRVLSSPICVTSAVGAKEISYTLAGVDYVAKVKDHQDNEYKVVQIGSQCWTKENMRATTSPSTGHNMMQTSPLYRSYTSKVVGDHNGEIIYNWCAAVDTFYAEGGYEEIASHSQLEDYWRCTVSSNRRGICPEGWHVPSKMDWFTLEFNYAPDSIDLGPRGFRGDFAVKLAGDSGWNVSSVENTPGNLSSPNRNISGFTAFPAGGFSNYAGVGAFFWTDHQHDTKDDRAGYHFLAYNNQGSGYTFRQIEDGCSVRCVRDEGSEVKPTVSTATVSDITPESAVCGGNVKHDGGAGVTARGICWNTTGNPTLDNNEGYTTDGTGTGVYASVMTGLSELTTYYVCAYATNSKGTSYGDVDTFTTCTPLTMDFTVNIGNSDDFGKVTINSTTATGAIWYNSNDDVLGTWISGNTAILPVDTYHVVLTNSCGMTADTGFRVLSSPICVTSAVGAKEISYTLAGVDYVAKVKDHQDNEYKVVQIGSQCWTKENMRCTTSPSTGSDMLRTTPIATSMSKEAVSHSIDSYGVLYNWCAAMDTFNNAGSYPELSDGSMQMNNWNCEFSRNRRGICPQGWHVPSGAEFTLLKEKVEEEDVFKCGNPSNNYIAKSLSYTTGWNAADEDDGECAVGYNQVKNNLTGFSAASAGSVGNVIQHVGEYAYFWSSTSMSILNLSSSASSAAVSILAGKYLGLPVRCVRDEGSEIKPTVNTAAVSEITHESAICGGNVKHDGGAGVTARGICWNTTGNPTLDNNEGYTTDGTGTGVYASVMTGLSELTTYYVCAYATNSKGTSYGDVDTFTTCTPLTMDFTVNMGNSDDFGKVTINSTTATGATWYNSNDDEVGTWTSGNTAILPVDTYHVVLTNSCGMTADTGFRVLSSPICVTSAVGAKEISYTLAGVDYVAKVKDHQDNEYKVVQIGSQCWTKENMRCTTTPSDPTVSIVNPMNYSNNHSTCSFASQVAHWWKNDESTYSGDGLLYNWCAAVDTFDVEGGASKLATINEGVMDGDTWDCSFSSFRRGICPEGWHVPELVDWNDLKTYVNIPAFQCNVTNNNISKSLASVEEWEVSSGECTIGSDPTQNNSTGFSAFPAGAFEHAFQFTGGISRGEWSMIWSATPDRNENRFAYYFETHNASKLIYLMDNNKQFGMSVRCIRNEGTEKKPTVSTAAVSGITHESAVCGGDVTFDGGANITARGICWSTSNNPTLENNEGYSTDGTGTGIFASMMTGLSELTTYYVRAYATNSEGTSYGSVKHFTTCTPLTMDYTVNMGNSDDFGKVTINSTTATGAKWYNSDDEEIGTWISGNTAILPVGTYHVVLTTESCTTTVSNVKVYCSPVCTASSIGAKEVSTYTLAGTNYITKVKDHQDNEYNVVQIGSQCWTKENMRCTTTPSAPTTNIVNPLDYATGTNLSVKSYVSQVAHWYLNDEANYSDYGVLYNWNAAMDTFDAANSKPQVAIESNSDTTTAWNCTFTGHRRGICPEGWHVPTKQEFDGMNGARSYISRPELACDDTINPTNPSQRLINKAVAASEKWNSSAVKCSPGYEMASNNASGLSLIPSGSFSGGGMNNFVGIGSYFEFMFAGPVTKTRYDDLFVNYNAIIFSTMAYGQYKVVGASVRCVRDE